MKFGRDSRVKTKPFEGGVAILTIAFKRSNFCREVSLTFRFGCCVCDESSEAPVNFTRTALALL